MRGPAKSIVFDFKKSCIFCGQDCVPLDPRHPERWDRVIKCMTTEQPDGQALKDVIPDVAEKWNYEFARRVKFDLSNTVDLPAADAQYHKRCYDGFMHIPTQSALSSVYYNVHDEALNVVLMHMFWR